MPSACAERDRFDLSSPRAIYLKFAICGLSIAAHAPKNVVRRTGRRRRSRSDAQAPARQIESVTSMHDIRQVRIPRRITRTARICRRALLIGHLKANPKTKTRGDDKSGRSRLCVRRSRLRENSSWVQQEKIAPSLGKVYAWVRARRLAEYDLILS